MLLPIWTYRTERAISGNRRPLIALFRPLLCALSPFPGGFGEGTSTDQLSLPLGMSIPERYPAAVFRPTRVYPFNSLFSSERKRQSVPWAMSFCGLDFIIPTSWRRSA
jgi:hypothetical protein